MKFIHDRGKHNKFWSYEINSHHSVTVSWGRLGTKGQSKTYEFDSSWSAQRFVDQKITEKRRKGYVEVDDEIFGLKKVQAELVNSGCKIETLTFVKKLHDDENDRTIYQSLKEEAALADPSYKPIVYCVLLLNGKRGLRCLLIDSEKVYSCWQMGGKQSYQESGVNIYRIEDIEEIDDSSSRDLKMVRDKAPGLIAALIR
jgi:predicted DNA-binding WGR domain protein